MNQVDPEIEFNFIRTKMRILYMFYPETKLYQELEKFEELILHDSRTLFPKCSRVLLIKLAFLSNKRFFKFFSFFQFLHIQIV